MRSIILIAHNMRSTHNVGSILRTAEGLGVEKVYLSGYTPYPIRQRDPRLPHERERIHAQIHKTALGAEDTLAWEQSDDIARLFTALKEDGYHIAALEQSNQSVKLPEFDPPQKLALLLGEEVHGIEQELLAQCEITIEIPMFGKKESFNVAQATAMALFHIRFAA